MRHIYTHTITAAFAFSREYDPTRPETLLEVLNEIDATRKGITEMGGVIAKDSGKPGMVRE